MFQLLQKLQRSNNNFMSELTKCNFCSHQQSLRKAKETKMKVTVLPAKDFGLGGVDEYIHPKNIKIKKLSEQERKKYRVGWYMELGESCGC